MSTDSIERVRATARVHLPLALRPEAGGAAAVDVACASVREALVAMCSRHPTLRRHLFAESGALRPHVNVFVNRADIRSLGGLDSGVAAGDDVHVVPSIAGG